MFYFKAKIYSSKVLSPQEANKNMPEEKKDQYVNEKIIILWKEVRPTK